MTTNFACIFRPLLLACAICGIHVSWRESVRAQDSDELEIKQAIQDLLDPKKNGVAADRLVRFGSFGEKNIELLIQGLRSEHATIRSSLAEVFAQLGLDAKAAVPALLGAIHDKDIVVRRGVINALGLIRREPAKVVSALIEAVKDKDKSNDAGVLLISQIAVTALGGFGKEAAPALPMLMETLKKTDDRSLRRAIIWSLGHIGPEHPNVIPTLIEYVSKGDDLGLRSCAAAQLGRIGPAAKAGIPALISFADTQGDDGDVMAARACGVRALGEMGKETTPEAIDCLIAILRNKKLTQGEAGDLRRQTDLAIRKLGPTNALKAIPFLVERLVERDAAVTGVAETLLSMGEPAVPLLVPFIRHPDKNARSDVIQLLGRMGPTAKVASGALRDAADQDPDPVVRRWAAGAFKATAVTALE